jgi:hypothetical protein
MWNFRRHRHLDLEILSEYLDGRLGTESQTRVSRQVDSCEPCRHELDSLRSTVSLVQALPELTAPRSFTLAAPPVPGPVLVRPPLPLRAPGWAYAGAASLAGLALAIMVSADTLGLFTPKDQADFSIQSAQTTAQPLPNTTTPEAGLPPVMATSPPEINSGELYDATSPEQPATPEVESIQPLRAPETLPESTEVAPAMAPAAPDRQDETTGLAAESVPGGDGATESADAAKEGTAFSETTAESPAEPSQKMADRSIEGPNEGEPGSDALLTPDQYRGTPIIWRVLEGIATALLLVLLGILAIKRLIARRIGG